MTVASSGTAGRSDATLATSATRLGGWAAGLMAAVATVTLVLGVTTPPRSGPFCTAGCMTCLLYTSPSPRD